MTTFFTVAEHWDGLPRELVETSSLEILTTQLDTVLGNLLDLTHLWAHRLS